MSVQQIHNPLRYQTNQHHTTQELYVQQESKHIRLQGMDSKSLLSKPRRSTWPRKAPSIVKIMTVPTKPIMPYGGQVYHEPELHLATDRMIVALSECFRNNFAEYSLYEVIAVATYSYYDSFVQLVHVLLYRPFDFAAMLFNNTYALMLRLPPFITLVVIPLFCFYSVCHAIRFALQEYQTFLDLGRGGTPSTPMGLVKVSILKLLARVDVLDPPHIDPMLEPYRGRLFKLPNRPGDRPQVKGVAPQRQFDQKTPAQTFYRLLQLLKETAEGDEHLKVTTSYLEGHTDALKARFSDVPLRVCDTDSEWDFEIAHPHKNDGSMHMILHPEDVRTVIECGWGERHPLATDALWWKVIWHQMLGCRRPVPYNLVLIYAPRTTLEYKMVKRILDAAIWFHKERHICNQINKGILARTENGDILSREDALKNGEWVDGPDGKLILLDRALDRGWYKWAPCGTTAIPNF